MIHKTEKLRRPLVILDIEANKIGNEYRIIQLGAVKEYDDGRLEFFDDFIKPKDVKYRTLTGEIQGLTRITQAEVDSAFLIHYAWSRLISWAYGADLYAWGQYDNKQLESELGFPCNVANIKTYIRKPTGGKPGGLAATMQLYGLDFFGNPHNGAVDALNTWRLLKEFERTRT